MNVYENLLKGNVILEGHFKLTSGRHSDVYINKDAIYKNPTLFNIVILEIEHKIRGSGIQCDVITAPPIAGTILAAPISLLLNKIFVYPEKVNKVMYPGNQESRMEFRRGYDKTIKDKKVFIVEDIITTGGSVQQLANAILDCGGHIVGVISIWNRSNWKLDKCENYTLINKPVQSWLPEECPICNDEKNRIPLRDPKIFK